MVAAALAFVGVFFFYRSRTGIAMRAVAYDQEAAMAQGINVGRVFAIAWAAGAVLAGTRRDLRHPATGRADRRGRAGHRRSSPSGHCRRSSSADSTRWWAPSSAACRSASPRSSPASTSPSYTDILGAGYPLIVPYVVMIIGLLVRPYGLFGTPEIRRV